MLTLVIFSFIFKYKIQNSSVNSNNYLVILR